MLKNMLNDGVKTFEPKEVAERAWADFCKRHLQGTPYTKNCISYYKFSWDHLEDAGKQSEEYQDFENPSYVAYIIPVAQS